MKKNKFRHTTRLAAVLALFAVTASVVRADDETCADKCHKVGMAAYEEGGLAAGQAAWSECIEQFCEE